MIRWKTAYFVPECSLFDSGEYIWGKEKQKQTSTYEEEKKEQMKKTKKLVMSLLLVFCSVVTLISPFVVNAAADDFEIIDDTDARFVYSSGNANNGGWESSGSGDASVTEHLRTTEGATLDITFNGT